MPLVFSTTIATFILFVAISLTGGFALTGNQLTNLLTFCSFALNVVLVVFFSSFYALLVLKPKDSRKFNQDGIQYQV